MNCEDSRGAMAHEEDQWASGEIKLPFKWWMEILGFFLLFFLSSCISHRYHQREINEAHNQERHTLGKVVKTCEAENKELRLENKKLRRELQGWEMQ